MSKAKLEIKDLSLGYGNLLVAEKLNLTLHSGELISIIGQSGVGKTSLFNVIAGTLKPFAGSIVLDGKEITGQTGKVSYMLQKDLLLPFKTVEENIALPLMIRGVKKKTAIAQVRPKLETFGLENFGTAYPDALSGGMRQRAALLRTYMFESDVALLDEPFSALDSITKTEMHRWFEGIMKQIHLSSILITHDIDEAISLSDRIYILKGKPAHLLQCIDVDLAHPRDPMSPAFLELKRDILKDL